jgi:hypothetical protein
MTGHNRTVSECGRLGAGPALSRDRLACLSGNTAPTAVELRLGTRAERLARAMMGIALAWPQPFPGSLLRRTGVLADCCPQAEAQGRPPSTVKDT